MQQKFQGIRRESVQEKQQGTGREGIEEGQQGTMNKLCKKRAGYVVAFNQAKTYTRQVAKNSAGKHATKVSRK